MYELHCLRLVTCVRGLDNHLRHLAACAVSHVSRKPRQPGSCMSGSGFRRCLYCATEYGVEVQEMEGKGCTLLETAWKDFGSAKTPALQTWMLIGWSLLRGISVVGGYVPVENGVSEVPSKSFSRQ